MTARFFVDDIIGNAGEVRLSREECHHLSRVLRLQVGDAVAVFDKAGRAFEAIVQAINSHEALLRIEKALPARGLTLALTVAISPIRPEAMSWLVQKLTELGVSALAPFVSSRTSLPQAGDAESDESRRKRWERISLAACKQCGRTTPIAIQPVRPFSKVFAELPSPCFFAWEGGDALPLAKAAQSANQNQFHSASIVIGPEGGFTAEEMQLALNHGVVVVDLGPNILRAETAAIAASAIILAVLGTPIS